MRTAAQWRMEHGYPRLGQRLYGMIQGLKRLEMCKALNLCIDES
jgi:hypothetical protein